MKTAGMNRSLWLALFALLAAVVGRGVQASAAAQSQPVLLAQPTQGAICVPAVAAPVFPMVEC